MIMDRENTDSTEKKRTLKKVRTQFLCRRPEAESNQLPIVPKLLSPHHIHIIDVSAGLIEKNRKILLNIHYSNPNLIIDDIITQDWPESKAVILCFDQNKGYNPLPWEYSVERLESYGNLELATWAQKIKKFYVNYPNVMEKYFNMVNSGDYEIQRSMERAICEARDFEREIAGKYPYKKITYLYRRDAKKLLSVTFSESMIRHGGQSVEDFMDWTKANGIPGFFAGDSQFNLGVGKSYLDLQLSGMDAIHEGLQISTFLFDINGRKRKVVMQHVRVFEPSLEGLLISTYAIIKSIEPLEDCSGRADQEQPEWSGQDRKCRKGECEER